METYPETCQIRLPALFELTDWVDEITKDTWVVLKRHSEFGCLSPYLYVYTWNLIRDVLERHLTPAFYSKEQQVRSYFFRAGEIAVRFLAGKEKSGRIRFRRLAGR